MVLQKTKNSTINSNRSIEKSLIIFFSALNCLLVVQMSLCSKTIITYIICSNIIIHAYYYKYDTEQSNKTATEIRLWRTFKFEFHTKIMFLLTVCWQFRWLWFSKITITYSLCSNITIYITIIRVNIGSEF